MISSHILDELSRLATYYGFIDGGRILKEMSAEELEAACRKCVHVTVSDTKVLARVLEHMGVDYEIHSVREADVFAQLHISQRPQSRTYRSAVHSENSNCLKNNYTPTSFLMWPACSHSAYKSPHIRKMGEGVLIYLAISVCYLAAFSAIYTFIGMLVSHKAVAEVGSLLLFFALLLMGSAIYEALQQPEFTNQILITAEEGMKMSEPTPNPSYPFSSSQVWVPPPVHQSAT